MELVQILEILLVFFSILLFSLITVYIVIVLKNKREKVDSNTETGENRNAKKEKTKKIDNRASIYEFMEFDQIKDNMIIRKNKTQYVMVVRCKGVNYDLMSEEEKNAVEAGFVQFLNTLRFPIQLYVQTTSLNLRDIIEDYNSRLDQMKKEIRDIDQQINIARSRNDSKQIERLSFDRRRKENILEYSADISEYIARMSANRNILQQKTYVVVSYYKSEADINENLSQEEADNICFSELYTRTQTVIRSLGASGVIGKILDSEELSELLYAAYNRDESEVMQLSRALDADYDALYSTGKDVFEKRKELLDEKIERESVDLATNSIKIADNKLKSEDEIIKQALEIIEEYKGQMSNELYNKAKEEVKASKNKNKENGKKSSKNETQEK